MVQLSSGIVVKEYDITNIIPSVSVSAAATVMFAQWGPVNEIMQINSENDLKKYFWGPNNDNANDWFTAANFLAYSDNLNIVRVINETSANTSQRAVNATAENPSGFLVRNDDDYNDNYNNGELNDEYATGVWIARYPGALGNSLKISVCSGADAFQSTVSGLVTVTANTNLVHAVANQANTISDFTTELTVGDLLVINTEIHQVASITNSSIAVLESKHILGATANTAIRRWEYYDNVNGAPGTSDYVASVSGTNDEMHIVVADEDGIITNQIGAVLEVYQYVSKASDALQSDGSTNYYKEVVNQKSQWARWAGQLTGVTNIGSTSAKTAFGSSATPLNSSLQGGNDGVTATDQEKIRGYSYFQSSEDIDISLILGSDCGQTTATYVINNICETRMDCFAFFSPPRAYVVNNTGFEASSTVSYRNTLPVTSYAALDCGWKWQYDQYNDLYRYVPLNGDIAGLHAQTDTTRDPWWAAAGFNRGQIKNVIKLAWNPKQGDRDTLYKNNINPVVTFPGDGTVLFGQKTLLTKPSAFDRINVRRLFIVLEKAISKAARYFLFEFNDAFTRAQFVNMVDPYLRDVQGRRGIYGYRIICDETNNTPQVIDSNQFVGTIMVQPERVAEFITLNFVAVGTGVNFDEIQGNFGA